MSSHAVTAPPASFGQQRLWFFEQLALEHPLYHIHLGTRLHGPLDAAALATALRTVVNRHEALRTTLRAVDGQPRQVIAEQIDVPTVVHDLTDVTADNRTACCLDRAGVHARQPFDLANGPLVRSDLLRFADDDHAWLLTMHHAVCDGWSVAVLFEEVSRAYEAQVAGREPALAPLPLQYADFALWQREADTAGEFDQQLAYWREQLRGAPELLRLPTDRPRPPTQRYRGDLIDAELPDDVARRVHDLARMQRVTPFMILYAALAMTLQRITGAKDIVVGTATAGRSQAELEPLIGFFTNTVPLRIAVDPQASLGDLLSPARSVVWEAQSHADVPFERIVEALVPRRDPSYHPLFQVMFDAQPAGHHNLQLPGIDVQPLAVRDRRISLFDYSISAEISPDRIGLVAEYATDLFSAAAAQFLFDAYRAVLTAAVAEPHRPVDSIPLLDPVRQRRLLDNGDRRAAAPPAETVPAMLAAAANAHPHAPAVVEAATGRQYDYRSVQRWSGAIAAALGQAGVRRGDIVALLARRSPAAIAGLLGISCAGAAYLPIDPDSPPHRIAALLADARPVAVLAEPSLQGLLPSPAPPVLPLASRPSHDEATAQVSTAADPHPDDLAYVMYTSGSTGRPKGVLVPHRGVTNYARADAEFYGLTRDDRVLQFTSLAFDVSAEEIFPCLAVGACLVLRGDDMLDTPDHFLGECERLGVTVTHLPTAYFHELVSGASAGHPGSLRAVVIGGEPTSPARVAAWHAMAPQVLLANAYGPTETSIAATIGRLSGPGVTASAERTPIGVPVPGAVVRLLDDQLEPVPPGGVGSIYIGGAGLARGYLGRPDLTGDRFVPDPFATGERLYRTGDLARLGPDGQLEFCGRVDAQVKIRGYRIEPAEVEAALGALPGVGRAAVVARHNGADHELVAYVETSAELAEDPALVSRLRDGLARLLPSYLVPTMWAVLETLPRTGTDKIDRSALPPVSVSAASTVAPQTPAEKVVADTWKDVLGVDQVGRDDDFFMLGGHSLLATRVVARLRKHFGNTVTLQQVFAHPRLAALAAELSASSTAAAGSPAAEDVQLRAGLADQLSLADLERLLPRRD